MQEFVYEDKHDFLKKLQELVDSGVSLKRLNTVTPYPVHEADHILNPPKSALRVFTAIGSLAGLLTGLWFTIFTVIDWPLITGGTPVVSLPAFFISTFELTMLFWALLSFGGFRFLSLLPSPRSINKPAEYGNRFEILVDDEVR